MIDTLRWTDEMRVGDTRKIVRRHWLLAYLSV
jgi:hypothetical protein